MPNQTAPLDRVFHALADPTRMAVIERLSRGPAAVSELAHPFAMALPSFTQHLRVLEDGGLVVSSKIGRVRTYRLQALPIQKLESWLQQQSARWEQRLEQLDNYLLTMKDEP